MLRHALMRACARWLHASSPPAAPAHCSRAHRWLPPLLPHADAQRLDLNACLTYPCNTQGIGQVTCTDMIGGPNSTLGRSCTCAPGREYVEARGCVGEHGAPSPLVHVAGCWVVALLPSSALSHQAVS